MAREWAAPSAVPGRARRRGTSWRLALLTGAVAALALPLLAGAGPASSRPAQTASSRSPAAVHLPRALFKVSRLDSSLARLAAVSGGRGSAPARRFAAGRGLLLAGGRVLVSVEAGSARAGALSRVRRSIAACGGRVLAVYDRFVSARVPVRALTGLAAAPGVCAVRAPDPVVPDAVSEGVGDMAAGVWAAAGFDGSGVKVGIVDVGFKGYQGLLGTERPDTVTTWGRGSGGAEGGADTETHGTSVAEVIHDVAPGAQLYFARPRGVEEFGLAVDWLRDQGVQVINQSMSRLGWGNSGTGPVNEIVSAAVSGGIFWANSAGNYRRAHWSGDFRDPDEDGLLDYDGVAGHDTNTFYRRAGSDISGNLWWDDSWTGASQDYDLWLMSWDGSRWVSLDSSQNEQAGLQGQRPFESVYVASAPSSTYYAWVVQRAGATRTDVDFDLLCPDIYLDSDTDTRPHYFVHERSLGSPADNPSAGFVAVAAVLRGPAFAAADYSSQGPTRDGRVVPEISGPTCVTNVSDPTPPFAGTSAASPHVAGIAAILRQAYPSCSPAEVEDLIRADAVDLGVAGLDSIFGWGRILLPAVPQDTTPPTTVAWPATARRGQSAVLGYEVDDAGFSAGPATVSIEVRNSRGRVVKRFGPFAGNKMCVYYELEFRCTLAKGTYRFAVQATDPAGNTSVRAGSARLVVR